MIVLSLRMLRDRAVLDSDRRRSKGKLLGFVLGGLGVATLFVGGPGGFSAQEPAAGGRCCVFYDRQGRGHGLSNVGGLGVRYTSFRPGRSALCVALLASATFLIVAIDSFRRSAVEGERGYRY
ncbi:MAG: hypothetical protein WKF37_04580 [Bryobacteraceae bacterium]